MAEKDGAQRACKDPNPIIDGRKANVNLAYLGAKPRGNLQAAGLALTASAAGLRYPAMYGNVMQHPQYMYQSPYISQNPALLAAGLSASALSPGAGQQLQYDYPQYAGAFQAAAAAAAADPYSSQVAANAFMPAQYAAAGYTGASMPAVSSALGGAHHISLASSQYAAAAAAAAQEARMQ